MSAFLLYPLAVVELMPRLITCTFQHLSRIALKETR